LLLLEDAQRGQALPEEKTVVIDKDLCVFWKTLYNKTAI
jgi:hypothetical protein